MTKEYRRELSATKKNLRACDRAAAALHKIATDAHRRLDKDLRAFTKSTASERRQIARDLARDLKANAKDFALMAARKAVLEGRLAS